jgi:hypothetical protein
LAALQWHRIGSQEDRSRNRCGAARRSVRYWFDIYESLQLDRVAISIIWEELQEKPPSLALP